MRFIVYNEAGKITRTGHCQSSAFNKQAGSGETVMEGRANDVRQKIVKGKIINKTSAEMQRDCPKTPLKSKKERRAYITNGQYQALLARINKLENK